MPPLAKKIGAVSQNRERTLADLADQWQAMVMVQNFTEMKFTAPVGAQLTSSKI